MPKIKNRIILGGAMLLLGGLILVLSGTVLLQSGLPSFIRTFYMGVGSSLTSVGGVLTAYYLWLFKHPEKARRQIVRETDEREVNMTTAAAKWSFYIVFFATAAALAVALPLSWAVFWTLLAIFTAMTVVFMLAYLVARRIM